MTKQQSHNGECYLLSQSQTMSGAAVGQEARILASFPRSLFLGDLGGGKES